MRKNILVVAQDAGFRAMLARALGAAGYAVELAEGAKRAREVLAEGHVDLGILAEDRLSAADKSLAWELAGAPHGLIIVPENPNALELPPRPSDARLATSSDTGELLAQVEAALRAPAARGTAHHMGQEVLTFEGFTLDLPGHVLLDAGGREVPLTRAEFAVLAAFADSPGRVLSRDQLRLSVTGEGADAYDRSVDVMVSRLRRKIESDPKTPRLILTVPGAGYKLAARLRRTIAPTPAPIEAEPALPRSGETVARQSPAERRPLTAMACEFAGLAALSARLDPEDLRELMETYRKRCADVIERHSGEVAQHRGDELIAYFGHSQAEEDHAERAVRAGLTLVGAGPECVGAKRSSLSFRIGVASGVAVVGGAGGVAGERTAVGEPPNLAHRLQMAAERDSLVIAQSTRDLVRGLFEYRDLGSIALAGYPEPVRAWHVVRPSAIASRFEALRGLSRTPLVGRKEELELLRRRWQQATQGDGRVVLLVGEAGIGKSRLAAALEERLRDEAPARLRYFCSPHHTDSALYPIIGQIERAAGFERGDAEAEKLAKLAAVLAPLARDADATVALVADLLSLPMSARDSLADLSPQKRREKTLAMLLAQFESLASKRPLLMIFEDVHWVDPTSLELLALIVDRVPLLPLLLLITARPEFTPPWPAHAHVTTLPLTRLSRPESAVVIERITGKPLPEEVMDQILARTDGVPLFVEELTKTVIEGGLLSERGGRYVLDGPLPPLAIPPTLHASLLARLDRLAPVREVAQIGAALGRQFSHELISAVAAMPRQQLDDALAQLVHAELIFRRGTPPDAEYTFKHALVQDAAYGTLLRSRRQQLHARIAATLEDHFPEIVAAQPALLARHCAEAGLAEKAVVYWLKAGQQALKRSAMTEAVAQLRKGLDVLAGLPDGPWRRQQELDLQIALRTALAVTKGWSAVDVGETIARARALAEQIDRPEYLVRVLSGQWAFHEARSEHKLALSVADQIEKIGEARNDVRALLRGRRANGFTRFWLGEFVAARALLERCHGLADPAHRAVAAGSEDPYALMLANLAVTLAYLGYIDQARSRLNEALSEARRLRHAQTLAYVLTFASWSEWITRSPELQGHVSELLALSTDHGFTYYLGLATANRGLSSNALGLAQEGLTLIAQGLTAVRATGTVLNTPLVLMWLAETYAMLRQPVEGLNCLAEAARIVETTEERNSEAELHRLRGDLLNTTRDPSAAERAYHQALAVARRQSATLLELRASISLARFWCKQGKRIAARDLLAPIYGWFTEGFDTPDLKEARALLDTLE